MLVLVAEISLLVFFCTIDRRDHDAIVCAKYVRGSYNAPHRNVNDNSVSYTRSMAREAATYAKMLYDEATISFPCAVTASNSAQVIDARRTVRASAWLASSAAACASLAVAVTVAVTHVDDSYADFVNQCRKASAEATEYAAKATEYAAKIQAVIETQGDANLKFHDPDGSHD